MAHFSLQLGAALVVPFAARRRRARSGRNWRFRALREAAAADRDGRRARDRGAIAHPVPRLDPAPAKTGGE